jgi:peptidoglycan hydrolase-like protein with peptidoglycan-binding domain
MIGKSAAFGALITFACILGVQAEDSSAWRLHTTLDGDARPFLCKDRETVDLVVAVLGHAIEARADPDDAKSKQLFELAAKLESEICLRPGAEDIVILRCNLDQKTFSNTTISIVKISALLRSNTSAGEQPFYAWTYAAIAGDENGGSSVQEANKRWCTEETVADVPLDPTPDLVQRVQQRFYDFGFYMPQIDGRLNPETAQALIDFQKWARLPSTGQLTKLTVEKIDSMSAPSPWVAAAFDGFGNQSMVSGATRLVAEADAVSDLRRKSRNDYRVVSVANPNCIALATTRYRSRRTTFGQAFAGAGTSEAAAGNNASDYCNRQKGGGSCQIRNALCPTGGEPPPRFDPENIPANAPAPQFGGGAQRFDPANLPVNAQAPGLSTEPAAVNPSESPTSEAPPERASGPENKTPSSNGEDKGSNP